MTNIIAAEANFISPLIVNKTYFPISLSSGQTSFSVTNDGTAAAPCRLSFTPINDVMTMEISGLTKEPIKMTKIMRGDNVTIDGINKKIQINGLDAYSQFEGWEFPKLQPCENTITMTAADDMALIELEFQPRYI